MSDREKMADAEALLEKEAQKVMETHGIGASKPPAQPAAAELFQAFCARKETAPQAVGVENHFYTGYQHAQLDWSRPVHGIVVDFKGDSMQIGMLLARLEACQEQYVFLGNPPPFNGGWHFTALNDFEHMEEQKALDASWEGFRIWHRVNYVPSTTEAGMPAFVPREEFDPKNKHVAAIPIDSTFKLSTIFFTGGLMPHTLNATIMADGNDAAAVVRKHFELGARFAAIGHGSTAAGQRRQRLTLKHFSRFLSCLHLGAWPGLDVLLALGDGKSMFSGFQAAVFPKQDRLLTINGLQPPGDGAKVCSFVSGSVELVSASYWGKSTAEAFFAALGLASTRMDTNFAGSGRVQRLGSSETVFCFDAAKLDNLSGRLARTPLFSAACFKLFGGHALVSVELRPQLWSTSRNLAAQPTVFCPQPHECAMTRSVTDNNTGNFTQRCLPIWELACFSMYVLLERRFLIKTKRSVGLRI